MKPIIRSAEAYARAFHEEQSVGYPMVDAYEVQQGFALSRERLEGAARVLACPVKAHPPNWQHGRVIYATVRRYLATIGQSDVTLVDIGTAKGFSALCMKWAADDSAVPATVWSCDVIAPDSYTVRNTVAEIHGAQTLRDIMAPWPEASSIRFIGSTGEDLLRHLWSRGDRVGVAFVDGKHSYAAVLREGELLAELQRAGDVVIFDDAQIDGVQQAVNHLGGAYACTPMEVLPGRAYAIGVRR